MALKRYLSRLAPPLLIVAGMIAMTSPAYAQRAGAEDQESQANQKTTRTPAMREKVYTRLAEAQMCSEMDDLPCAEAKLAEVREMTDLNSYETAQMWNFYAYIYFEQENYDQAIKAYESVLQQPDLPAGLEQTTMYSLATLYVQQEQYQKGLDMLDKWFPTQANPGPEPYILKAQIHYQLEQFKEGIEPVLTAMRIAQEQNREPQEGWYQLLNVFYFELENYPKVIETLTTMLERWPKRDYLMQLAGIYGQEGQENKTLALYQAAYSAGWLDRGSDFVNLAQMLLSADVPYQAGKIMEEGLNDGTIESTEANWRILAQAWQLAQEDLKALPALSRASSLASDGNLDMLLAQSYANLARWDECVEAARSALKRGELNREDQTNMILGNCLVEQKKYGEARNAFQSAARDERSRRGANQWLQYIDNEESREKEIAAAMRKG